MLSRASPVCKAESRVGWGAGGGGGSGMHCMSAFMHKLWPQLVLHFSATYGRGAAMSSLSTGYMQNGSDTFAKLFSITCMCLLKK